MQERDRLLAIISLGLVAGWVIWSYSCGGIINILMNPELDAEVKLHALRLSFKAWGPFAPLAYILFVIVEVVVAPIPGTILYLPGGVIFGGFWGGTFSLIGNIIGAGISSLLIRTLIGKLVTRDLFSKSNLDSYQEILRRHSLLAIILLRLNPLTSSDIVSYAAGLTGISTTTVMLGTLLGMAPLCYIQAYLSMELFVAFPWLLWPLITACILYAVGAVYVILKIKHSHVNDFR